jgi:phage protein D
MTMFWPAYEESVRPENRHFYAPGFEVKIEGENLPRNVLRDVMELKYIDSLTEIDRFEITVSNWDPTTRQFKFIGSEPTDYMTSGDPAAGLYKLFQPCEKKVEILLGYTGKLLSMMAGNFTTMEPNFPSAGAPTLTVTGLNVLHSLRREKFTTAWVGKKPSEIAKNIATLKSKGKARFPLPIEVDDAAAAKETPLDYTAQTNQTDVDFLLNLARQHSYELVVLPEDKKKGLKERLRFGPGKTARTPVNYELAWGRTLIDFKPVITSHNQVKSVTVNGWDRAAKKPIKEKVDFEDKELKKLNADLREFIQCEAREELVVDRPVFTKAQAQDMARAILRDRASSVIKATGHTVGLPELKAGTKIYIDQMGARLSGEYLVTKTEHALNDKGYVTKFEARRENLVGAAA